MADIDKFFSPEALANLEQLGSETSEAMGEIDKSVNDQAVASPLHSAKLAGMYRRALITSGVPVELTDKLVTEYVSCMWSRFFQVPRG